MSIPTIVIGETEAPGPLAYRLAPADINYGVDRCRGRLFPDESYDRRWEPAVGREAQCGGRVDEDFLCSRCLHNLARWRESCGTAERRGNNQDWWGRVDDPMPRRAPTLGTAWAEEVKPTWKPVAAPAVAPETVESLTATLAALTAEYAQIHFDYECLVEEEDDWPRESDDLDDLLLAEQAELRRLNKAIKDGVILPPAVVAIPTNPAAVMETVESLRVKVAEMRKKRDDWKRTLDDLIAEGWVISKRVRKAFADVREKTAVAREHLALRAENAAFKSRGAAAPDAKAEIGALRARIVSLEEELADADSLCESLSAQLAGEVQRTNEVGDSARSACRKAADFKAQFEEADFHRRAFEEANGRLMELNGRLRAELEEAFAAKRQFSEDLDDVFQRAVDAEESAELVSTSNAALQYRCDEQEETIAILKQTIEGLQRGLEEASAAKLRFSDDFAAALKRAADAERHVDALRVELAAMQERAQVAEHEVDEAGEESDALQCALAHGDDREDSVREERDAWMSRYRDMRRLIGEVVAGVERTLDRYGDGAVSYNIRQCIELLK
jgi:chromosome segregation ATPase